MEHETKQTSEDNAGGGGLELDKKYAVAVEKFITKEWGKGDWEMGFIKCMVGYAASLSEEVKEAVIEHGPEKAFEKIHEDFIKNYRRSNVDPKDATSFDLVGGIQDWSKSEKLNPDDFTDLHG